MGPAGVLQFQRRAAGHRHLPSGQSRISRPDRLDGEGEAQREDGRNRLFRHARRHRQPHHHGQWPRRARLGSRRHRGRSRHARPAAVDASARGDRLQARGRIARGRDRHRPRADRHRDAAQEGRGRQIRRVLRRGPQFDDGRRSRHAWQHGSGIWRDLRPVPDRRADARLPEDHWPQAFAARARRILREGARRLSHPPHAGPALFRYARAQPRRGHGLARRPEAAAGPHCPRPAPRQASAPP